MKRNILFGLFFFVTNSFIAKAQDTKIVTSQATYVLTPPENCINSNCLNGIIQIAKLAGTALAADINKTSNEAKSLDNEIKTASSAYEAARADYATAKAPYDAKLAVYVGDVDVHNREVAANNAKKPEDRAASEVDRLNRNKSSLDDRKAVLDSERDLLMIKWNGLQSKKDELSSKTAAVLNITDKLSNSLEQLQRCKSFGEKALVVAKEKNWGTYQTANDFFGTLKIIPSMDLLNGNLEQMKAWSNKLLE